MITIIHGDNTVASRTFLSSVISQAATKGEVVRVVAKELTISNLESFLASQSLFAADKTVVIEGVFSLARGKQKTTFLSMIAESLCDVILWDSKVITPTDSKLFPKATIRVFKASSSVFSWVESVRPGDAKLSVEWLKKAIKDDGEDLCFALLCRQVRMLIKVKDGDISGVPPFAVAKLKKQANMFTMEKLRSMYERLTIIDEEEKTSGSPLTLVQKLDLLLLTI